MLPGTIYSQGSHQAVFEHSIRLLPTVRDSTRDVFNFHEPSCSHIEWTRPKIGSLPRFLAAKTFLLKVHPVQKNRVSWIILSGLRTVYTPLTNNQKHFQPQK